MAVSLSVNINKYALLRNARGHGLPDLCHFADIAIAAGAHGITVHPRRDQRHIRFDDVPVLSRHLKEHHPNIEYNIECEDAPDILRMVLELHPDQCTLVPVTPGEVTSDHGWNPIDDKDRLQRVIEPLRQAGIRVSCFADCDAQTIGHFAQTGTHRVELYTGPYAWAYGKTDVQTKQLWAAAKVATDAGLLLNAGHDLDRHNLAGLKGLPGLREVSIGHAQICRALEVGTDQSIKELLAEL